MSMAVRTLEELRRDQQELLQQLQTGSAAAGSFIAPPGTTAIPLRIGKVTQVVTSDATYGPHLVVRQQVFSGQPPAASDSSAPARRAYPSPNRAVGDYVVNEYVALWVTRRAEFALKLA